jgi:Ni/Co efflux regulator RcnB
VRLAVAAALLAAPLAGSASAGCAQDFVRDAPPSNTHSLTADPFNAAVAFAGCAV